MKSLAKMAAAIGAAMVLTGAADATIVTLSYSGYVDSNQIVGAGSTFSATMVYDTTGPVIDSGGNPGANNYVTYRSVLSYSFASGSVSNSGSIGGNSYSGFFVSDSFSPSSADSVMLTLWPNIGPPNGNSIPGAPGSTRAELSFSVPYTFLSSTAMPTDFNAVLAGNYPMRASYWDYDNNKVSGIVTAMSVTTDASAVPEPASWAMMIGGFGAVGVGMRRRRALAAAA